MSLAATETLKYNIDISNLAKACDRMAEVLKKHKINSNEYVSEETSKVANQVVEKLNNVTIINNYTTINNVPEQTDKWTRSDVFALIQIILAIIGLVSNYLTSQNLSEISNELIQSINDIAIVASDLINMFTNQINLLYNSTKSKTGN